MTGRRLVLDRKEVEAARERIKTRYNVIAGAEPRRTAGRGEGDGQIRGATFLECRPDLALLFAACPAWQHRPRFAQRSNPVTQAVQAEASCRSSGSTSPARHTIISGPGKNGAVLQTRARRSSFPRSRPGDRRFGREPELCGAGARRDPGKKWRPTVEVVDYEANLALLEPTG